MLKSRCFVEKLIIPQDSKNGQIKKKNKRKGKRKRKFPPSLSHSPTDHFKDQQQKNVLVPWAITCTCSVLMKISC